MSAFYRALSSNCFLFFFSINVYYLSFLQMAACVLIKVLNFSKSAPKCLNSDKKWNTMRNNMVGGKEYKHKVTR